LLLKDWSYRATVGGWLQVVWAPNSACVLISASDDGLVTIFDFKASSQTTLNERSHCDACFASR
jgi:hypothetical protein